MRLAKERGRVQVVSGSLSPEPGPSGTAALPMRRNLRSRSPPVSMRSLGSFKPQIARRIAEKVYGINWRRWEEARRGQSGF